jgi:hypothetical protein
MEKVEGKNMKADNFSRIMDEIKKNPESKNMTNKEIADVALFLFEEEIKDETGEVDED